MACYLKDRIESIISNRELQSISSIGNQIAVNGHSDLRNLVFKTESDTNLISAVESYLLENHMSKTEIIHLLYQIEKELIDEYMYIKASEIRKYCHDLVIDNFNSKNNPDLFDVYALVERNMKSEAMSVCEQIKKRIRSKINLDKLSFYSYLFCGSEAPMNELRCPFDLGIKGKTILIIGPAISDADSERYDVVIRVGFKGGDRKCDISFYNVEATRNLYMSNNTSFMTKLNTCVFFKFDYSFQKEMYRSGKAKLIYTVDYMFENGQPNLLQNILFHVLRNQPGHVYLTGFNLYLSKNAYSSDYKKSSKKPDYLDAFAEHNIISQFTFLKNLYNNGFFECDDMLTAILDGGLMKYLNEMQTIVKQLQGEWYNA